MNKHKPEHKHVPMYLVLRMRMSPVLCLCFILVLEAAILLVNTKNRDLWSLPIFEHAQETLSIIFSQLDLSDLTIRPLIADFRCWQWPEVSILGADQKDHGLWGRECLCSCLFQGREHSYAYFTSLNQASQKGLVRE